MVSTLQSILQMSNGSTEVRTQEPERLRLRGMPKGVTYEMEDGRGAGYMNLATFYPTVS